MYSVHTITINVVVFLYLKVLHALLHLPPVCQEDIWVVSDYISQLVTGSVREEKGRLEGIQEPKQ